MDSRCSKHFKNTPSDHNIPKIQNGYVEHLFLNLKKHYMKELDYKLNYYDQKIRQTTSNYCRNLKDTLG